MVYRVLHRVATAHFCSLISHHMAPCVSLQSLPFASISLGTGHLHMLFPLSRMLLPPVKLPD